MLPLLGTLMLTGMTLGSQASPKPVISTCEMADDVLIKLLQSAIAPDQHELSLRTTEKLEKTCLDMPGHRFVGEPVMHQCIGNTLTFALAYDSPYRKGVSLRGSPTTHQFERIDFAEKSLPSLLYLDGRPMQWVIANTGHETGRKYLIYR